PSCPWQGKPRGQATERGGCGDTHGDSGEKGQLSGLNGLHREATALSMNLRRFGATADGKSKTEAPREPVFSLILFLVPRNCRGRVRERGRRGNGLITLPP